MRLPSRRPLEVWRNELVALLIRLGVQLPARKPAPSATVKATASVGPGVEQPNGAAEPVIDSDNESETAATTASDTDDASDSDDAGALGIIDHPSDTGSPGQQVAVGAADGEQPSHSHGG